MRLNITRQETNSRGELLLRSFFGVLYIGIPHFFCLFIFSLWGSILGFVAWWTILFTGKYPKNVFDYKVKLNQWGVRVSARFSHLLDGYPAFGLDSTDSAIEYVVPYSETYSRGQLLLITFLGWIIIPHVICLLFMMIASGFVGLIAWWSILITGKFPEGLHTFQVSVMRWGNRVGLYMAFMYPKYPPFNGKPDEEQGA